MLNPTGAERSFVPRSIPDEIANAVQADIIIGRYEPGQRLVERQLSERFQVSSIPIREALLELEQRGLVIRRTNRGCSVVKLSPEELDQICELRELLEPKVAEWTAGRLTPEGKASLDAQLELLRRAAEENNIPGFFEADLRYHRLVWQCSENPYAAKALTVTMGSLFAHGLRDSHGLDLRGEYEKHERLHLALTTGQPEVAHRLLTEIATGFRQHLRARFAAG